MKPFSVMDWMRKNGDKFEEEGMMHLFNGKFQSVIEVYGHGEHLIEERAEEMFFWQLVRIQFDSRSIEVALFFKPFSGIRLLDISFLQISVGIRRWWSIVPKSMHRHPCPIKVW